VVEVQSPEDALGVTWAVRVRPQYFGPHDECTDCFGSANKSRFLSFGYSCQDLVVSALQGSVKPRQPSFAARFVSEAIALLTPVSLGDTQLTDSHGY
jgi:hypothetical protein